MGTLASAAMSNIVSVYMGLCLKTGRFTRTQGLKAQSRNLEDALEGAAVLFN